MSNETLFYKVDLASRAGISRLVSRIVPPHEIEDIVQETYVRLCQVENKDNINSPQSFMFKTARNLALDHQKQAGVRLVDGVDDLQALEHLMADYDSDEPFENASSDKEFAHFCQAVRLLPIQCRKVFVLKKVYGYSQKEIAQQLQISQSTVEKHIATGMKRCTLFMRDIQQQSDPGQHKTSFSKTGGTYE